MSVNNSTSLVFVREAWIFVHSSQKIEIKLNKYQILGRKIFNSSVLYLINLLVICVGLVVRTLFNTDRDNNIDIYMKKISSFQILVVLGFQFQFGCQKEIDITLESLREEVFT